MMTDLKRLGVLENRNDVSDVVGLDAFYIASVAYHFHDGEISNGVAFSEVREHPSTKTKALSYIFYPREILCV